MKKLEKILKNRNNLVGFLNILDIKKINELLNIDVNHYSYEQICEQLLSQKKEKQITKKDFLTVFDILIENNSSFRTESHRYEDKTIY